MILVLDNEISPDYRYLGPEIARHLGDADYHELVDEPDHPPVARYDGVALSGSTHSVYDEDGRDAWFEAALDVIDTCLAREIPLLGICYGHQLINHALGGRVEPDRRRATFVEMTAYDEAESGVLTGLEPVVPVLHKDLVTELGEGMTSVARTDYDAHFCSVHETKPVWTVQFHPEYTEPLVENTPDWDPGDHTFEESNSTRVFDNFDRHVARLRGEAVQS